MERIVETDSKGRLTLGMQFAHQRYLVEQENGNLVLRRAVVIPEDELWLYQNPEAMGALEEGIQQAREGKLKKNAVDLDKC